MGAWSLDTAQWPLVWIHTRGEQSVAQTTERMEAMDGLLRRGERFAAVLVIDDYRSGDRSSRSVISRWLQGNEAALQRLCAGMAFVYSQPVLRFAMTSILLFVRKPVPFKVFESRDAARAWAEAQLAAPPAPS